MSRGQLQAHRLLADHGIVVEPSDIWSDGVGTHFVRVGDDLYVVHLDAYPAPFVERELPIKRLGVRQRVRLKRPEPGQE